MRQLFNLNAPYPFYYSGKTLLLKAFYLIVATTLLLYATQPFKVALDEQRVSYFFTCLIHALAAGGVFFFFFGLVDALRDRQKVWRIVDEILALIMVFSLIGIAEFLVRDVVYTNIDNWTWHYLLDEVSHTFIIGIVLGFIFVPLNYRRLYRKHLGEAEQLESALGRDPEPVLTGNVFIETQIRLDDFELNPERMLYAKAAENYVEIYLLEADSVLKLVKRIALKNLLEQLNAYPYIIRTHRSYLINKKRIVHVAGNAQGYQLTLANVSETLPVSRNFIKEFNKRIRSGL